MVLQFALFAALITAGGDARLPLRPDFVAMIPPPAEAFFAGLQDKLNPARQEAEALAEYLNRVWNSAEARNEPLCLLTAIQQFDCALMALKPNPTAAQALERVRAYRPVLALARQQIEKDKVKPKPIPPGQLNQLPAQLYRMNWRIEQQYYPPLAGVMMEAVSRVRRTWSCVSRWRWLWARRAR